MREIDFSVGSPWAWMWDLEQGHTPYESPGPIFKYLPRKYADTFVNEGTIRIAPIWEFRDQERHGGTIHDAKEGQQRLTKLDADHVYENPAGFQGWQVFAQNVVLGTNNQIMAYNQFDDEGVDNCYVWCFSSPKPTPAEIAAMGDKDTLITIEDWIGFFVMLGRKLVADGIADEPYIGRCNYKGELVWTNRLNPNRSKPIPRAILKAPAYAGQQEHRIVFPTRERPPAAQIITVAELTRFVSTVEGL